MTNMVRDDESCLLLGPFFPSMLLRQQSDFIINYSKPSLLVPARGSKGVGTTVAMETHVGT